MEDKEDPFDKLIPKLAEEATFKAYCTNVGLFGLACERDLCVFCKKANIEYSPGYEPWCGPHLICPNCTSTYNIKHDKTSSQRSRNRR